MKRAARTRVSVAVAVLAAATFVSAPANARTMQLDDLRKLVGVSSPAISPDGKRAVVVVSRVNWNESKNDRDLDLIDVATRARRTLTYRRKGLSDPRWSPDGTKLAFVADAASEPAQPGAESSSSDAKPQVFVMPMDGGDARPVTTAPEGVEQFAWRPDGGAIAYAATDALPKKHGAERFRDAFVVGNTPITTRKPPRPVHLFVVATSGGAAKQLTSGEQSIAAGEAQSTLSWSADGKTIAFLLAPNAVLNDAERAHVELVDVASGKLSRPASHTGYEADPRFSPDGKHLAYKHSEGDNQITLDEAYVTTPDGGNGTAISHPVDRAVHDVAWLPDSSGILFTAHDGTAMTIRRASLGGAPARVDVGDLNITSPLDGAIAKDGAMVFVATSTKQPAELYYRAAAGAPVKLTGYNAAVAGLDLAAAETIAFPTSLGVRGDAVLTLPPGYAAGRTYPLVVHIHGGPTSASIRQFDRQAQLMAAHGWIVLQPNYRGSDNLGLAYQRGVLYDPSDGPGKDIMAAVDAVRARGIVDDKRIAVGGWSYGGIMTAWMISKYHIWRAAVSGASVNDWATDYGTADDLGADKALFHGSPFVGGNAAEYRKASAISYVRDVTTPVLIVSDVGDNRDPFATSSMYYRALRDNGKDATFIAYPVDGHFPADPVRTADLYGRWIDWFARHLQ